MTLQQTLIKATSSSIEKRRLITQAGHGFTGVHPITYVDGQWEKATTVVTDGVPTRLDNFLCLGIQDEDSFWFAACHCEYSLPAHGLGANNTRLYVSNTGTLTDTPPATGQNPLIRLGIGTIVSPDTIYYSPSVRPI